MEIKLLVKQARIKAGMSQTELAQRADISRSYLNELGSGKYTNPGINIMCRLASALNCKIDDLVDYKKAEEAKNG